MSAEPALNLVESTEPDGDEATTPTPLSTSIREVYRLIRDNLDRVGGIECAAAIMGCDRGDLRRALDHGWKKKGERRLAVQHVMAFGERLAEKHPVEAQRLVAALLRPFDMIAFPRVQITAAERARRHENLLRTLGAAMGVDLVAKSLETP